MQVLPPSEVKLPTHPFPQKVRQTHPGTRSQRSHTLKLPFRLGYRCSAPTDILRTHDGPPTRCCSKETSKPSLAAAHLHHVSSYALLVRALSMSTVGRCVGGAQQGELQSPSWAGVSPLCTCSRLRTACGYFSSFCHAAAHSAKLTLPSNRGPRVTNPENSQAETFRQINKRTFSACQSINQFPCASSARNERTTASQRDEQTTPRLRSIRPARDRYIVRVAVWNEHLGVYGKTFCPRRSAFALLQIPSHRAIDRRDRVRIRIRGGRKGKKAQTPLSAGSARALGQEEKKTPR